MSNMSKNKPRTVTLLLPTLNEVDGMRAILPTIDRNLFDDILVVDGGSTDGTVECAIQHNVRIMSQLRKGLGLGVMDAIATLKTDCVIEFSLDGNCMIEQLPDIVKKLKEGHDLVIVSRYLPPAKSFDDNIVTAFGNWMFTQMIGGLGKFPLTDSLTMYRGYHTKITKFPEFEKFLRSTHFQPLTSAVGTARGLNICEIPGDEPRRIGGKSKMSVFHNGTGILIMVIRMYIFKWFFMKKAIKRERELLAEETAVETHPSK
jgi:glycosyltransferase involved in cell wall biosynthesis